MTGLRLNGDANSVAAFATLTADLHAAQDLDIVLERTVAFVRTDLAGDCAGIVLWPGHGLDRRRSVGSDWRFAAANDLQQLVAEGPGASPLGADVVMVCDALSDGRWPRWGPRIAAQLGLLSVLSVPMTSRLRPIGVLIVYATRPDAFDSSDQAVARLIAVQSAAAVTAAVTAGNLRRGLDSRTQVGQATGVLMERFGVGADEAVAMLRRYSQDHNISMSTVAADLVNNRRLPPPWDRPAQRRTR